MIFNHKSCLHQACLAHVDRQIETARQAMEEAQAAANQETKSSVGDKYETGRAMMQLETEKFAQRLAQALELRRQLEQLPIADVHSRAQAGSLVFTSEGNYFLAAALGKVILEGGQPFYVLSTAAPLGQALLGKTAGEFAEIQGRRLRIERIE